MLYQYIKKVLVKFVSLTKYEAGVNRSPTCSKAVSPRSQAKENEYRPEVRVKTGTAENGLSRVARYFSQLIDGKLPCSSRRSG